MQVPQVPSHHPLWWPVAAVVVLNAVPIVGVVFWGWSAFALILLYWLEHLIVGVRTLLSMAASALRHGAAGLLALGFIGPFFTLHYGLFCFVHGIFVFAMFGAGGGIEGDGVTDLVGIVSAAFAANPNLAYGLGAIALWQAIQFMLWLARGEASRTDPLSLMAAPYPRIIVLHMAIIGGGVLLMALDWPLAGVIALALMKTLFDIGDSLNPGKPHALDPARAVREALKGRPASPAPSQSPSRSRSTSPAPPAPRD